MAEKNPALDVRGLPTSEYARAVALGGEMFELHQVAWRR